MKILIDPNASEQYRRNIISRSSSGPGRAMMPNERRFYEMLQKVDGQWLEVETDYLFSDQFNTVPVPGVSEQGLRIMAASVVDVEDDARPGKARCQWCGKTSTDLEACSHCGKDEYLTVFKPCPHPKVSPAFMTG